jgi:hypothetical protein
MRIVITLLAVAGLTLVGAEAARSQPWDGNGEDEICYPHPCANHTYEVMYSLEDGRIMSGAGWDANTSGAPKAGRVIGPLPNTATLVITDSTAIPDLWNNSNLGAYYVDVEAKTLNRRDTGEPVDVKASPRNANFGGLGLLGLTSLGMAVAALALKAVARHRDATRMGRWG